MHARGNASEEVIMNQEDDLCAIVQWFTENGMTANLEKFQFTFLGSNTDQEFYLRTGDQFLSNSNRLNL